MQPISPQVDGAAAATRDPNVDRAGQPSASADQRGLSGSLQRHLLEFSGQPAGAMRRVMVTISLQSTRQVWSDKSVGEAADRGEEA